MSFYICVDVHCIYESKLINNYNRDALSTKKTKNIDFFMVFLKNALHTAF